jgi:hypothetical protein
VFLISSLKDEKNCKKANSFCHNLLALQKGLRIGLGFTQTALVLFLDNFSFI